MTLGNVPCVIQRGIALGFHIQHALKGRQIIRLHRRAKQLLEPLQIVDGRNASGELTGHSRIKANRQRFSDALSNPLLNPLLNPLIRLIRDSDTAGWSRWARTGGRVAR